MLDQLQAILRYEWLIIGNYRLDVGHGLLLLLIWGVSWLLLRILRGVIRKKSWFGRMEPNDEQRKVFHRLTKLLIYPLAFILSLQVLGLDIGTLLKYQVFSPEEEKGVRISHLLGIVLTVVLARGILWYLYRWFVSSNKVQPIQLDQGRRLAIYQIIKYAVVLLVILLCLTLLQVNLSVLWVGTTGLLLVVGLALQQTFNDFFSGLLILLDGTLEVGDLIFIDSLALEGEVQEIRLRTTVVETLDSQSVIVPNSTIASTNVVNWTYNDKETRFRIQVGVAYGSNVQLVRKILRSCAASHGLVLKSPEPRVRFVDFGESSLDFELLFWLSQVRSFEDVKSDLRYKIEAEFRRNEVSIPFPQRDLHIRSDFRQEQLWREKYSQVNDSPRKNDKEEKKKKATEEEVPQSDLPTKKQGNAPT